MYDLTAEMIAARKAIKVGDHVRAFDFEPRGIPEIDSRYVEGVVTEVIDGYLLEVKVEKDNAFPERGREIITTPIIVHFGEWDGRLTVLN